MVIYVDHSNGDIASGRSGWRSFVTNGDEEDVILFLLKIEQINDLYRSILVQSEFACSSALWLVKELHLTIGAFIVIDALQFHVCKSNRHCFFNVDHMWSEAWVVIVNIGHIYDDWYLCCHCGISLV